MTHRTITTLAAAALVLGACGSSGDDSADDTTTTDPPVEETTTTLDEAPETTEDVPDDTVDTEPEDDLAPAPEPDELPGEQQVDSYPHEGDSLAVVGIEQGSVLHVRVGPSTVYQVLRDLEPTATDLIATGHNRYVDDQNWAEVILEGDEVGWVDTHYALQLGGTRDITDELEPNMAAETMADLGHAIAEQRGDPAVPKDIALIEEPQGGDLFEALVDVIGMPETERGGERLHILAEPAPGGEGFVLESVHAVDLCVRGVDGDEACI